MTETNAQPGVVDSNDDRPHAQYPPASVPLTPPLTSSSLGRTTEPPPSLLDINYICVSAGRAAITLALQHARIGEGDEVLVPAYHCESMIAPVEHVGATPVYYRIHANTNVDLSDLESRISSRTRAILATHYFGFPQKIVELRSICDRHKLVLIEDCAHAFFGSLGDKPLGSFGDYAVGSAMKFFPMFDGGLLASATRDLGTIELFQPSSALEIKGLVSVVEYAMRYGRLKLFSVPLKIAIKTKDAIWGIAKKAMGRKLNKSLAPSSSEGGYALEPQWIKAKMSRVSRFILCNSKIDRITWGRRGNYNKIVSELSGRPGIKPLFDTLPDGVIPLVVPMIVDNPEIVFPKLKHAGVPIWRFGEYLYPEINEELCANTMFLSRHVFQFPCHPELTRAEIQWMLDTIKQHLPVN